jgi:uncharacterized protein with HEPN domain
MSNHEIIPYIIDIYEFSNEVISFTDSVSYDDFINDRKLVLAILKLIENIGEAASKVPLDFRQNYSNIPWSQIIGMRNKVIHGYNKINYPIVWNTIKNDYPNLIQEIIELVPKEYQ